jgi:hypothetical protein
MKNEKVDKLNEVIEKSMVVLRFGHRDCFDLKYFIVYKWPPQFVRGKSWSIKFFLKLFALKMII